MIIQRFCRAASVVAAVLALQGCAAAIGYAVYDIETDRLDRLRAWESSLAGLDCVQLGDAYAAVASDRDSFVDFDQRQDIMRDAMTQKSCTLPADLA
ncbi:MAG: hypothetical protein AAGJ28_22660 [Pseudomonadota bacterium]